MVFDCVENEVVNPIRQWSILVKELLDCLELFASYIHHTLDDNLRVSKGTLHLERCFLTRLANYVRCKGGFLCYDGGESKHDGCQEACEEFHCNLPIVRVHQ